MQFSVEKGQKTHDALAAEWSGIACQFHRGESVVDHEEVIEAGRRVAIPVYSENVGHQPDCPTCVDSAFATYQHIEQVRLDREQSDFEFEAERARRGL